ENLTKYFGPVLAVYDITFAVAQGEIVGLLGPNGAGKTTTMRVLTTYLPATSGAARVAGQDVRTESMEVRRNIGYLPESVPLYPEMRVEEYLNYRAKLKGVDRKQRQRRIDYCLDRCRIREVRRRLISTLSKGYRQRVGLDKKLSELATDEAVIVLEVRGPAEQVGNVLRTTEGVAQVAPQPIGDGLVGFEIRTHHHKDLREAISQRMYKNGWTIRRLDLRRRTLEDHFVDVVMRDEEAYLSQRPEVPGGMGEAASNEGALA